MCQQLEYAERPSKRSRKFIADGMLRLLSDEAFTEALKTHLNEQEQQERELQARKKAREEFAEVLEKWQAEETLRKKQNKEIRRR